MTTSKITDNLRPRNASERLPAIGQPWPEQCLRYGVLYLRMPDGSGARLRAATAEEYRQARHGVVYVDGARCGVEIVVC